MILTHLQQSADVCTAMTRSRRWNRSVNAIRSVETASAETNHKVLKMVALFWLDNGSGGAGSIPAKTTRARQRHHQATPFFLAFKGEWVEDRQPRLRGAKPEATLPA